MTQNCKILADYVNALQQGTRFTDPYKRLRPRPETKLCVQCGSPYTLSIPYELCNPVLRDLCDDCLMDGKASLSLSLSQSGADPDQLRALKIKGVTPW